MLSIADYFKETLMIVNSLQKIRLDLIDFYNKMYQIQLKFKGQVKKITIAKSLPSS